MTLEHKTAQFKWVCVCISDYLGVKPHSLQSSEPWLQLKPQTWLQRGSRRSTRQPYWLSLCGGRWVCVRRNLSLHAWSLKRAVQSLRQAHYRQKSRLGFIPDIWLHLSCSLSVCGQYRRVLLISRKSIRSDGSLKCNGWKKHFIDSFKASLDQKSCFLSFF